VASQSKHFATLMGLGLAAMLLTAGRRANAYPEYPAVIDAHLDLHLSVPLGETGEQSRENEPYGRARRRDADPSGHFTWCAVTAFSEFRLGRPPGPHSRGDVALRL
jgi:hypothetical protein